MPGFLKKVESKTRQAVSHGVRKANDELNPLKKARDQRDDAIKTNVAELTRQFEDQKKKLSKELSELRKKLNEAKANIPVQKQAEITKQINLLDSEISHLNLFKDAIYACMNPNADIEPLKKLLDCHKAGESDLIEAFMTCNPLGIAMLFEAKDAVNYLYVNFIKHIKPNANSIIGLTLNECLNFINSPSHTIKVLHLNTIQEIIEEHKHISSILNLFDEESEKLAQCLDQYLRLNRVEPLPEQSVPSQEVCDNNYPDAQGSGHAAYLAAEAGDLEKVKHYIEECNVYPDYPLPVGIANCNTLLGGAAWFGRLEVVIYLVHKGADISRIQCDNVNNAAQYASITANKISDANSKHSATAKYLNCSSKGLAELVLRCLDYVRISDSVADDILYRLVRFKLHNLLELVTNRGIYSAEAYEIAKLSNDEIAMRHLSKGWMLKNSDLHQELKDEACSKHRQCVSPFMLLRKQYIKTMLRMSIDSYLKNHKQHCETVFINAKESITVKINEDADNKLVLIEQELAKIDGIHATELQKLTADYNKNESEIRGAILTQAKLGKRKIYRNLALTTAAIAAGGWAAPQIAGAIGFKNAVAVSFIRGAVTYTTTSAVSGKFTIIGAALSTLSAGVGSGIASGISGTVTFVSKDFVAAATDTTVGAVMSGSLKNIFPKAMLSGSIQVASATTANILVPLSEVNYTQLRAFAHNFSVGTTASIMYATGEKVFFNIPVDLSMSLVRGINAALMYIFGQLGQAQAARQQFTRDNAKKVAEQSQTEVITPGANVASQERAASLLEESEDVLLANNVVTDPNFISPNAVTESKTKTAKQNQSPDIAPNIAPRTYSPYARKEVNIGHIGDFTFGFIEGSFINTIIFKAANVRYLGTVVRGFGWVGAGIMAVHGAHLAKDFNDDNFIYTEDYENIMRNALISAERKETLSNEAFERQRKAQVEAVQQKSLLDKFKENPKIFGVSLGMFFGHKDVPGFGANKFLSVELRNPFKKIKTDNGLIYEGAPYHGRVNNVIKNKAPFNPKYVLENSVQIKDTAPHRIAYDSNSSEIVILMQHETGVFHGHVRTWAELNQIQKNVLTRQFGFTPNGKPPRNTP